MLNAVRLIIYTTDLFGNTHFITYTSRGVYRWMVLSSLSETMRLSDGLNTLTTWPARLCETLPKTDGYDFTRLHTDIIHSITKRMNWFIFLVASSRALTMKRLGQRHRSMVGASVWVTHIVTLTVYVHRIPCRCSSGSHREGTMSVHTMGHDVGNPYSKGGGVEWGGPLRSIPFR